MSDKIDWEKRGRAAERVIGKYYNILYGCPEFIEWEATIGPDPHFINRDGNVEPVIPESMQKHMEENK